MTRPAIRKIQRICRRLGLRFLNKKTTSIRDFLWTGSTLFAINGSRGDITPSASELLHEVAHWQVAAPSRRRYSDFGLLRMTTSEEEEDLALFLGTAWDIHIGRDILSALIGNYYMGPQPSLVVTMHPGSTWYISADTLDMVRIGKEWAELGRFLYSAMQLQNLGYLKNGRPTYHTNPGRPSWTRTNSRSSKRSATSFRKPATPASMPKSNRGKTSASATSFRMTT